MAPSSSARLALVTGATGYIGSRLVPELLAAGFRVRVLTRKASNVRGRDWFDLVEVVEGDAADPQALAEALAGVDLAYYLLHSMDGRAHFDRRDRALALGFGQAAREQGVGRLVYLSGLHPDGVDLSSHLQSRVEVGQILLASGVPTVVLQAAMIIGSGSASFEMLRQLTRRLPAMVGPRWLRNRIQPIAIRDVLHYLLAVADLPTGTHRTFDIGGPDMLTYRQMIHRFAEIDGLRPRPVLALPMLTPWLAAHWVGVVTAIPASIARPLVGSLVHEVVCREHDLEATSAARGDLLLGFDAAVHDALAGEGDVRPEPGTTDPARSSAADPQWAGH
jgi:uncharacterized protein YbjT (DUF2867 family)